MKPNKENIRKWVDALRSGEFRQGRGLLRPSADTYCCLGVACAISGVGAWIWQQDYLKFEKGYWAFEDSGEPVMGELTAGVRDWLGIIENNPILYDPELGFPLCASLLNDAHKRTFEQIANAIEATWLND